MKEGLTASPQVVDDIVDFVASLSKKNPNSSVLYKIISQDWNSHEITRHKTSWSGETKLLLALHTM